jgi:uncharacterized protein (DUF486 family)
MNSFAPLTQHPVLASAVLLTVSNLFMTFAWYGHLKHLQASPWWTAALIPTAKRAPLRRVSSQAAP